MLCFFLFTVWRSTEWGVKLALAKIMQELNYKRVKLQNTLNDLDLIPTWMRWIDEMPEENAVAEAHNESVHRFQLLLFNEKKM